MPPSSSHTLTAALTCLRNVVTLLEHDETKRMEGRDSSQRELTASFKGTNGIVIADSLESMGRIMFQQGEFENALVSLLDALLRKESELGNEHHSLYSLHREIAMCKAEIGDADGAARSFDDGIALLINAARREKRSITDFISEEENHIHLHLIRGQNHQLSYDIGKAVTSLRTALGTVMKPRLDISKYRDRCRQGKEVVATILHFLALSYVALEEDDHQSVSPEAATDHENGLQAIKYFEKSLAWLSPRCR
jgi:tetratricopeptide (TPR) repeat protein